MSALSGMTIGGGGSLEPASARVLVRALMKVGNCKLSPFLSRYRLTIIPPIESSIAPINAPMNTQRLFPDIIPAPFRTKGDSDGSGLARLSGASIETINLSGGTWFGTSCISVAIASDGPPALQQAVTRRIYSGSSQALSGISIPPVD